MRSIPVGDSDFSLSHARVIWINSPFTCYNKLAGVTVRLGEGYVRSCPDTDIDPQLLSQTGLGFWFKNLIILKKEVFCFLQSDLEVQLERMINEKKECVQNLDRLVTVIKKNSYSRL